MATTKTLAAVLTLCVFAGCDAEGDAVGPRGGVVMSADGRVTLEIPPGALDHEVEISIEVLDDVSAQIVGSAYAIEPEGLSLLRPATLSYDLTADVDTSARSFDLKGADLEDLVLVSEKAGRWYPMADRALDTETSQLSASVLYFTAYALASR